MANLSGLAALFRLRPDRAADYLAAKGYKLSGPYWEMDGPQHSHLFTVANLAKLDVLTDIRSAVQKALDEGQTEKWFDKQLVDVLKAKGWWGGKDGSLRRLQTIYRTNLQTAYMAGRHQQAMEQKDRRPWAQYLAVRDQRSRPAHAALHGQVFRIDSPAWAAISPPNGYNSLLPWQRVSGHSFVGLKAWYAGPAVEIFGKSGSRLAVTAQHPVLTVNGWVAAGDLRQGDQLIGYRSDIGSGSVSADLHKDNPPPTIEEVFQTLSLGGSCALPRAAMNLYGDVVFIKGDVDVVTADRQLLSHFEAVRQEFLAKLGFHDAHETEVSLSGDGSHVQVFGGQGSAGASIGGPQASFFWAESSGDSQPVMNDNPAIAQLPADALRAGSKATTNLLDTDTRLIQGDSLIWQGAFEMRLVAQSELNAGKFMGLRHGSLGYAPLADVFIGGVVANPSAHRDIINTQAGLIELDDIVNLRFFDYTGHVYDLETATGNIIAYGGINTPHIIVSNCRCRARYLSDEDLKKRNLKPATDIQILEREPPGNKPVNPATGESPQRWIQRGVSVPSKTNPGERDILWADPGWDNIPGSDGAERALVDRLMAKATDLGDGVRMAVQAGLQEVAEKVEKAAVAATVASGFEAQATAKKAAQTRLSTQIQQAANIADKNTLASDWIDDHRTKKPQSINAHGMEQAEDMVSVSWEGIDYWFKKGTFSEDNLAELVVSMSDARLPRRLTSATKRVIFSDQPNMDDAYWAVRYNDPDFSSLATGGDGTIVIYRNQPIDIGSLAHEMGHNLATKKYGITSPSPKSAYGRAMDSGEEPPTDYAKNSPSEDFAESVRLYFRNPQKLKSAAPKRYTVIKKIIESAGYGG